jgi:beta-glucosidase
MPKGFPQDFLWGTATAAYQIEGADMEDGKSASIWTAFSHTPGTTAEGHTGDIACDHYHRYEEDVMLIKELGTNAYRFSIAWSRVLPNGNGPVNEKGLDFYRRLVDRLLENYITPFITLYHWDLPLSLQEKIGGWESKDIAQYFGDYASVIYKALGDRVKYWVTLNEPFCSAHIGYSLGDFAPGQKNIKKALNVAHNLLRAHGEAVIRFRESVPQGQIGLVNVANIIEPASGSEEDFRSAFLFNQISNDWFFLPLLESRYPEEAFRFLSDLGLAPVIESDDMKIIAQKPDFWGINYYTRNRKKLDLNAPVFFVDVSPEMETTEMGWEIYPEGLYLMLKNSFERYGNIPLYITENGMADKDVLMNGVINDERRIGYLKSHIEATRRAIRDGVDVRGYFVWSLMDNFEWASGYNKRFGLVYTDYANEYRRIKKDSYFYYKNFLAERG